MTKVYVVAWAYDTGGGFDWYHNTIDADSAYEKEKNNVSDSKLAKENWSAFRFDIDVTSAETATDEIDSDLITYCKHANIKHGPLLR